MFRSQRREGEAGSAAREVSSPRRGPRRDSVNPAWHRFATAVASNTTGPRVQPKLTVGAPDDKYEREADRTAERVMRMPEPMAQAEPPLEDELEQPPTVQRLRAGRVDTLHEGCPRKRPHFNRCGGHPKLDTWNCKCGCRGIGIS